jgi:hypothetical protein
VNDPQQQPNPEPEQGRNQDKAPESPAATPPAGAAPTPAGDQQPATDGPAPTPPADQAALAPPPASDVRDYFWEHLRRSLATGKLSSEEADQLHFSLALLLDGINSKLRRILDQKQPEKGSHSGTGHLAIELADLGGLLEAVEKHVADLKDHAHERWVSKATPINN